LKEPRSSAIQDSKCQLQFQGDEIRKDQTVLGKLVTVDLESVPDLHTITLTLVVPSINLGDETRQKFKTLAIRTTTHTSIGGPALVEGPLQTYDVFKLKGTAQQVDF
jgi:hypothetical protein